MVDAICVIMVFHVLISEVALTNSPGNGTCGTSVDGFKCCTDYIRNGSRCVPCIGSFGLGCNTTCHPGYYGFGCKKKCECEQCDKLNGSCIGHTQAHLFNQKCYGPRHSMLLQKFPEHAKCQRTRV
ncbi:angiopoietin-1 receptor-like isoform X2 [Ostrea edulis]|uniref:angiopoietin-1 receptor-like isoform X2 n=1 Tax=Ostrea edulis TaxID=37623 RepID=UPI0024AFDCD5|nr:angiopoietin-1 receptor-like isoform X2 [Ostrea edulis]